MRCLTALFALALAACSQPVTETASAPPAALSGTVSSEREGAMEGVVVSAKKGIVTVSVVSAAEGRFRFPVEKLSPGEYALSIKAVGYDLESPRTVTLGEGTAPAIEAKLVPAADISAQLSNLEWLHSIPGEPAQKRLVAGCTNCHTVQRIMATNYDAETWKQVIQRMATYSNNSFHLKPQLRAVARDLVRFSPNGQRDVEYLASINRSKGELQYEPKPMSRVSGEGTKVVITEYDLPRKDSQPHDVIVEPDGTVWYSDFGDQFLGRLNTNTLEVKEYPIPVAREGLPKGALDLEKDAEGNFWLGMMFQSGVAKFDRKTEKVEIFPLTGELLVPTAQNAMVAPQSHHVDGKVWMAATHLDGLQRLDLRTGKFETFEIYKDLDGTHSVYSIFPDAENNLWFLDYSGEGIGRMDAKTLQMTLFPTPTPRSRPRRGRFDDRGRIWFAEHAAERIGMFDPETGEMKEWEVPGGYFAPYDVAADKEGKVWTAGMTADRVLRLDPETGNFVEYPLPRPTNVRRIFVDNSGARPVLWIGNNHGAAVIKVELVE